MDGNPLVTPDVLADTLRAHRARGLRMLLQAMSRRWASSCPSRIATPPCPRSCRRRSSRMGRSCPRWRSARARAPRVSRGAASCASSRPGSSSRSSMWRACRAGSTEPMPPAAYRSPAAMLKDLELIERTLAQVKASSRGPEAGAAGAGARAHPGLPPGGAGVPCARGGCGQRGGLAGRWARSHRGRREAAGGAGPCARGPGRVRRGGVPHLHPLHGQHHGGRAGGVPVRAARGPVGRAARLRHRGHRPAVRAARRPERRTGGDRSPSSRIPPIAVTCRRAACRR